MYATTFIIPSTINTTANNITAVDNAIPGFAIKNIALGYSLPSKWMKSIGFDSARLTATADNVVLFNHVKGMNPQYNFTGGTDFGYVPVRTISFGIDITF